MRVGKDGQGKEDARLTRIVLVRTLVLVLLAGLILLGIAGLQRRTLRKAVFFRVSEVEVEVERVWVSQMDEQGTTDESKHR